MQPQPASEVYQPAKPNVLQDEPLSDHYQAWGYSIGYEMDTDGQPVPENGNTAVFRIAPHGMTEPVFVTKPEEDATFTVNVLSGQGRLIRARADGVVENIFLDKDDEVAIRPGEAYTYINTGQFNDLVLHDVALPAFKPGDDVELTASYRPKHTEQTPQPQDGQLSCRAKTPDGEMIQVDLPTEFYEEISRLMRPREEVTIGELNTDLKYNAAFVLGGLAMFGAGVYGTYSIATGKHSGFEVFSWPTGATTLGGFTAGGSIRNIIGIARKRRVLNRPQAAPEGK